MPRATRERTLYEIICAIYSTAHCPGSHKLKQVGTLSNSSFQYRFPIESLESVVVVHPPLLLIATTLAQLEITYRAFAGGHRPTSSCIPSLLHLRSGGIANIAVPDA